MISREIVTWAYRLLLDREPESAAIIDAACQCESASALVDGIIASPEFLAKHAPVDLQRNRWVLIEHALGFRIWINLADHAVSRSILGDTFEGPEVAFVRGAVRTGHCALDIGTNIGFYSLLLSSLVGPSGRVIGFEPLVFLHAAAVKSLHENRFHHCQIHHVALGSERGTAHLVYAPGSINWGGAFLSFSDSVLPDHSSTPVPVAPLTDFVHGIKADFIKIDVEGAELLVMRGCADYLRANRPMILSEIHAAQLQRVSGASPVEYVTFMRELGYSCREILADGNLGQPMSGREDIDLVNVAFVPK